MAAAFVFLKPNHPVCRIASMRTPLRVPPARLRAAHSEIEAGAKLNATRRNPAVKDFLGNAARVADTGVPVLTEAEIQAEIGALRKARRRPRRAGRGR